MVIKRSVYLGFIGFIISSIMIGMIPSYPIIFADNSLSNANKEDLKTNDPPLVEKIFPFYPEDNLRSFNLTLDQNFMYYIWVEIVTPNSCNLTIQIFDPDDFLYDIARVELDFQYQNFRVYEIPFGTALSGEYTFEFIAETEENLNIFIQVEKGDKVLFDKITPENRDKLLVYNTTRFFDEMYITYKLLLKSDYIYKMFIGRVSPISEAITGFNGSQIIVRLNYTITDPYDNIYTIFRNEALNSIDSINISSYGTYCAGYHTFNLSVCFSEEDKVEAVNIGHAINEDSKKGDIIIPANETDSINDTHLNDTSTPRKIFHIPEEWTMGFLIFVASLVGITSVLMIKRRNKRNVGLAE
ncbi:MAG: hypothetical protein ACFFCI_07910 [Promethearchaeota archaeon]